MNKAKQMLHKAINNHNIGCAVFWDHPMTTWCDCKDCIESLLSGKDAIHTRITMKAIMADDRKLRKSA